eukprot:TRINITY_DN5696_c0_g1_i1.p1 TRINITY_DN5696_c0_g1~~TRINITY_DN5696_c0_g1_i1.p1  ORF type:complete len:143 (+),score=32.81 TRINITY_DN5696_c0_g1_i1:30-458(+)
MASSNRVMNIIFNVLNIILSLIIVGCGINHFFWSGALFTGAYVLGIFIIFAGVVAFIIELKPMAFLIMNFGFFRYWIGRGLFYICISTLCVYSNFYSLVFTIPLAVTGIIYIVLQFVKIPLPKPILGDGDSYEEYKPLSSSK